MKKELSPLIETTIPAGFPRPSDDPIETPLDLHTFLVKKPAATFFIRVEGDSMEGAGIFDQDLLIVDRSITQVENKIVVARIDQEFTVKRLIKQNNRVILYPENPKYSPKIISEETDFEIWGVVTYAIHTL